MSPMSRRAHPLLRAVLLLAVSLMLTCPSLVLGSESPQEEYDPAEIVIDAAALDGKDVTVTGEVIGDRLHADDDHVWVNVLGDQGVAVGVWMSLDDSALIHNYGDYSTSGDRVLITGSVNAACDAHGGDLDVHASSLEVVEVGHEVHHEAEPLWAALGVLGIAVALVLARVGRLQRLRAPSRRA